MGDTVSYVTKRLQLAYLGSAQVVACRDDAGSALVGDSTNTAFTINTTGWVASGASWAPVVHTSMPSSNTGNIKILKGHLLWRGTEWWSSWNGSGYAPPGRWSAGNQSFTYFKDRNGGTAVQSRPNCWRIDTGL